MSVATPARPSPPAHRKEPEPRLHLSHRLAERGVDRTLWLLLPGVVFLIALFIYPLLYGLGLSFQPIKGTDPLANYKQFFSDHLQRDTIGTTLRISLPPALLNVLVAVPIAYRLRGRVRGKRLLTTFLVIPITLGTVLTAEGMLKFFNPTGGWFNKTLSALGLTSPDGGALVRVIAGDVAGHQGPGVTHTPITLVHATLTPGASLTLPWRPEFNALVYALAGRGTVGRELRSIRMGQLAAFGQGDALTVAADATQESRSPTLDVLVLGGRPIGEPVVAYGPFVMNTKDQIVQAIVDYQAGRLGSVPAVALMPHGHVRAETEGE